MPSLTWLPNETVFSLCSRSHIISGHRAAHQTTKDIFQLDRPRIAHDLPNRLQFLEARFCGNLGTAEEIATTRTILAFYLPFLDEHSRRRAIMAMCNSDSSYLTRDISLAVRTRRAATPLRYCPECAKQDHNVYGTAYWHLDHQYPGACICVHHRRQLIVTKDGTHGLRQYNWTLPNHEIAINYPPLSPQYISVLLGFQKLIIDYVASYTSPHTSPIKNIPDILSSRIDEAAGSTTKLLLGLATASRDFHEWLTPFRQVKVIDVLPNSVQQGIRILQTLTRTEGNVPDPLYQVLVISWLFKDWKTFLDYCNKYNHGSAPRLSYSQAETDPAFIQLEDEILDLIALGTSPRRISQMKNVSVEQILRLGKTMGFIPNEKSTHPNTPRNAAARRLLWQGTDKQTIQASIGISKKVIDHLLAKNQPLSKQWRFKQREKHVADSRATWNEIANQNPGFNSAELQFIAPKTYAWLYRNDREWIILQNSKSNTNNSASVTSVRIDHRDSKFAHQLGIAAERICRQSTGTRISRDALLNAVPDLKAALLHLSRFPLTHKALVSALKPGSRLKFNGRIMGTTVRDR